MGESPMRIPVHLALAFLIPISASSCDGTSPHEPTSNVSGIWDARFEGTVHGSGTSQSDDFVLELAQSGSSVTGTVRFVGLNVDFPLTGTVTGDRFQYRSSLTLAGCELRMEAETVVDAGGRRFTGTQTQSSCEGAASGRVEATHRQ
jgi:hypothetical protein